MVPGVMLVKKANLPSTDKGVCLMEMKRVIKIFIVCLKQYPLINFGISDKVVGYRELDLLLMTSVTDKRKSNMVLELFLKSFLTSLVKILNFNHNLMMMTLELRDQIESTNSIWWMIFVN